MSLAVESGARALNSVRPIDIDRIVGGAVARIGGGAIGKSPAADAPRFDAGDLYGRGGPSARDIKQDALGDCYAVATMGALANQRPDLIRDMIRYDARTGNFQVTLHDDGREVTITVTQEDLAYNLSRQGGSTVDNTGRDGPVWPAVVETAYAKMLDSNPDNGLKQGFDALGAGGKARDAMEVLTGSRGTDFGFSEGFFESRDDAIDRLGKQAQAALGNGRPLTLSTDPENRSLWETITGKDGRQDGLVDNHVYVVEGVANVDGEWQVTLRNPWGTNQGVSEGKDSSSATITVNLDDLVATGGLEYFNAGSAR